MQVFGKFISALLILSMSNLGWASNAKPIERKPVNQEELHQKMDSAYEKIIHDGIQLKDFSGKEISKADLFSGKISDVVMTADIPEMQGYAVRAQRGEVNENKATVVMTLYTKDMSERLGSEPIVIDSKKTDEQNYLAMQASVQTLTRIMKPEQASLWKKMINQLFPSAHARSDGVIGPVLFVLGLITIVGIIGVLILAGNSNILDGKQTVIAVSVIAILGAVTGLAFFAIDRFAPQQY